MKTSYYIISSSVDLKAWNNPIYLSLFVCHLPYFSKWCLHNSHSPISLRRLTFVFEVKWHARFRDTFQIWETLTPVSYALSIIKSWQEKLELYVRSRCLSNELRFLLALFLISVLFISLRILLQIIMSTENTHTSHVERLPGLLVCVSICVHSVISPASGRNWRITDLSWMLLTNGGCLFPVVHKHRLNHRLLNQSARHNDYGIVTPW